MYPKNAASPEKIAIGAVVQISDGAVQTSGCTVRILTSGDAEGDGGGTTAYSTDGIVLYTPTQVESNHASFILIAKKTGCIPASITVVPTLSATPGEAVCASTQKVDVETIKTRAVVCSGEVTVPAATLASTTNITAGTIATVTTVTGGATSANQDTILAAVSGIGTAGGAAINVDANDDNVDGGIAGVTVASTVLGTVVGALTTTSFVDISYQTLNDDGGQTTAPTIAYQFLTGGGTTPVGCTFVGYVNNTTARIFTVQAWKFGTGWEAIGQIVGQPGTSDVTKNFVLYPRHVGTAAGEVGKVYIRFLGQGTNTPKLYVNQLYVTYAVTSRTVGYADGAVWIKAAGTALAESYVNGTADNPCPYANAKTVAAAVGLTRFRIVNGETVTLDASAASKSFIGKNWTLAMGSQAITGAYIEGATVSGISSGAGATFVDCHIGTATIDSANFIRCTFTGELTMIASGVYHTIQCVDGIPGTSNPTFTFAANAVLGARQWCGGANIKSFAATNMAVFEGSGKLILDTNCRLGDLRIRGPFAVVLTTGCTTVPTQTEVLNSTTIPDAVWDEASTGHTDAGKAGEQVWTNVPAVKAVTDKVDTLIEVVP